MTTGAINADIRRKSPDLRGLADIRLVTLEDGPGRGQRLLMARNATGIAFEVAVDRGFDLSTLSKNGVNIGWHSPNQLPFPAFPPDGEDGWAFLRNFDGFMATCGLDHFSRPRDVDVSNWNHPHLTEVTMPLHGRISTAKARLIAYGVDQHTGEISCEGIVRQASVFGDVLELRRRIVLSTFGPLLSVEDTVTNLGYRPCRHGILYHLNFGYPFLDDSLDIHGLPAELDETLRDDAPCPADDYGERVDTIDSIELKDGVILNNPGLNLSVGLRFDAALLPKLAVWRAYQSGIFALGIEPKTNGPEDLALLGPQESLRYGFQLSLRSGNEPQREC